MLGTTTFYPFDDPLPCPEHVPTKPGAQRRRGFCLDVQHVYQLELLVSKKPFEQTLIQDMKQTHMNF